MGEDQGVKMEFEHSQRMDDSFGLGLSQNSNYYENLSQPFQLELLQSSQEILTPEVPDLMKDVQLADQECQSQPNSASIEIPPVFSSDSDDTHQFNDIAELSDKDWRSVDVSKAVELFPKKNTKMPVAGGRVGGNILKKPAPSTSSSARAGPSTSTKRGLFRDDEEVVLSNWGGDLNFKVIPVTEDEKAGIKMKRSNCDYSEKLNKLYCKQDVLVVFKLEMDYNKYESILDSASNYKVRTSLAFEGTSMIGKPVLRCRNHKEFELSLIEKDNKLLIERVNHVLLPEDLKNSEFHQSKATKRCFVVTPVPKREAGIDFITKSFKFTCLNTCMKTQGSEAPGLAIIFCLFNDRDEIVGRSVTLLRVCTAPGRDRNRDEGKEGTEKSPGGSRRSKKRGSTGAVAEPPAKICNRVTRPRNEEFSLSSQETIYEEFELGKEIRAKPLLKKFLEILKERKYPTDPSDLDMQFYATHSYQMLLMIKSICDQADAHRNKLKLKTENPEQDDEERSPDNGFHEPNDN